MHVRSSTFEVINSEILNLNLRSTKTPKLIAAILSGDVENIVQAVKRVKRQEINERDRYGCTALMYAANLGNVELVKALLSRGADKTVKDAHGKTAIEYAMMKHCGVVIELQK